MPVNWCIRQDSHLQTLRSKRRMIIISPRMRKWGPAKCGIRNAECGIGTALDATLVLAFRTLHSELRIGNGGSPRCCPVLCGLRDRCIAAMLSTRTRHEGGVEPPQPGL